MARSTYEARARDYAQRFGLDPALYSRVIQQESGWNPNAVSPVGAQGLAQVMPATARDPGFGVAPLTNPADPDDNLRFGAEYLAALQKRYPNDPARALAAYNWGAGNADKWDGRMETLPQETRNYVASIMGENGPNRAASEGIYQNTMTPFFPGGRKDDSEPVLIMSGRNAPADAGVLAEPAKPEPNTFLGKVDNWIKEGNRSDQLLAIGAGLLAGDDWASGISAASQNLLAVNQQDRDNRYRDERLKKDQTKEPRETTYYDAGNYRITGPDGEEILVNAYSKNTAPGIYYINSEGEEVLIPGDQGVGVTKSEAGIGGFTTNQWKETSTELVREAETIKSMDRVIEILEDSPQGLDLLRNDIGTIWNTLTSQGLTPEQLDTAEGRARLQGLLGGMRLEVVGGGVMTEQDAHRVITAMGGDMQSYLTANPEVSRRMLKELRDRKLSTYNQMYNHAEAISMALPHKRFIMPERYVVPNQRSEETPEEAVITESSIPEQAETSPAPAGEVPDWMFNSDPATWTPEQMEEAERIWGLK